MEKSSHKARKLIYLAIFMGATGCCTGAMNGCEFDAVTIGDRVDEYQCSLGKPAEILHLDDGTQEYVYIQHDEPAQGIRTLRRYTLVVDKEGVVINKYVQEQKQEYSVVQEHIEKDHSGIEF